MINEDKKTVSHIISLTLGIISILTIFFWYISLPCGITSIILGIKSYKNNSKKLGVSGMITGIVGISLCVLVYVVLITILILKNNYVY